jgi:polyisoprenoid-binding protein YceI
MSTTASNPTVIPAGTWSVDQAHSTIGFAVKHMGIATVRGKFNDFEGTLEIGEDLSTAKAYGR